MTPELQQFVMGRPVVRELTYEESMAALQQAFANCSRRVMAEVPPMRDITGYHVRRPAGW